MYLADLPSTLAVTNVASRDLGIAGIRVAVGQTVTVNLGQMGPERRSTVWIAATAAATARLVTTSPPTAVVADVWHSGDIASIPSLLRVGPGGQSSPGASIDGLHVVDAWPISVPGPESVPTPGVGPAIDFSDASNSQYAAIILYL